MPHDGSGSENLRRDANPNGANQENRTGPPGESLPGQFEALASANTAVTQPPSQTPDQNSGRLESKTEGPAKAGTRDANHPAHQSGKWQPMTLREFNNVSPKNGLGKTAVALENALAASGET